MKKAKKQILGLAETSMIAGGSAMAIGSIGGNTAGITNAMKYAPAMGSMVGAGMVMRTISNMDTDFKRTGRPYKIRKGKLKGRMSKGY